LQAKEVMTAGDSVERINSKSASDSNKKTKAEQAFQKTKEERVSNREVSELYYMYRVQQIKVIPCRVLLISLHLI